MENKPSRGRGRPKGEPTKWLNIRVKAALRDRLDQECTEQGRTLRATVERILESFFGSKSKGK